MDIPIPKNFKGRNLFDIVYNKVEPKEYIFSGGAQGRAVLIRGQMKYYRYKKLTRTQILSSEGDYSNMPFIEELYDLSKDPLEKKNILSENKELVDLFRKKVERLFSEGKEIRPKSITPDQDTTERLKALGYL